MNARDRQKRIRKQIRQQVGIVTIAAALVLLFQNCSSADFGSPNQLPKTSAVAEGGGHAYDGKVFIRAGICSDGTVVESRIVVNEDKSAALVRENCQNITPRAIAAAEFEIDPADPTRLLYAGLVFEMEQPAIAVPATKPFYYQNTDVLRSVPPSVYITSLNYSAEDIRKLKAEGHIVICEFSAGSVSPNDPDFSRYASSDIGELVPDTVNDRWIDVRSSRIRPIMEDRMDEAKANGCDGVMPTMVDGYMHPSGFPLTPDVLAIYSKALAFMARDRKLLVVHMNAVDVAEKPEISEAFDMALTSRCFSFGYCDKVLGFVAKKKPVFALERVAFDPAYCAKAKELGITLLFVNRPFDGSRYEPCQ